MEIMCIGDSEILHEIVGDTRRISSSFSDFVKYHELFRVVEYLGIPLTLYFLLNSVQYL